MAPKPSVFGHVSPYQPEARFDSRTEVRDSGLHRHLMNGISGSYLDGADAIVVSGGYADDEDHGDWILYTGEGGRDSATKPGCTVVGGVIGGS